MENDLSLLLSNTLFGDGASAAVVWSRPEGYELVGSASRYVPEQRDSIRYVHKKGQLHNQLSLKLPGLVRTAAAQVVADVLLRHGLLKPSDVRHWALHSGGEKIINAVRDEIGLSEEQVRAPRRVLEDHGNMSSPTVWFVLKELEQQGDRSRGAVHDARLRRRAFRPRLPPQQKMRAATGLPSGPIKHIMAASWTCAEKLHEKRSLQFLRLPVRALPGDRTLRRIPNGAGVFTAGNGRPGAGGR